jgi:hypothetical protein
MVEAGESQYLICVAIVWLLKASSPHRVGAHVGALQLCACVLVSCGTQPWVDSNAISK